MSLKLGVQIFVGAENLCKPVSSLLSLLALRVLTSLASRLTSRECDCLAFVASGLRIAEIAQRLGVSVVTIEFHLRNARQKLGAQTRDHAVALALMRGAINP